MKHPNGAIIGVSRKANPTVFQKTMGINDFYWGEEGFDYPMGQVQLSGNVNAATIAMESSPIAGVSFQNKHAFEALASHSVDWWLTSTDPAI